MPSSLSTWNQTQAQCSSRLPMSLQVPHDGYISLTFTFMHLADALIQTDLQCIQVIHLYCQYVCSLGIEPTTFALLTQCSNHWATGTLFQTLVSSLLVVILTPPHRFQVELISVCDHECLFSEIQSTIYLRRTSAIWVSLPVYCKKPLRRNQRASW